MNKKISVGLALSITAIVATLAIVLTYTFAMNTFDNRMSAVMERQEMYAELSELDAQARLSMLDTIDEQELSDSLLSGYVDGLGDKYAQYLTVDEYQNYLNKEAGTAYGLGIDVSRDNDGNILVNRVHSGSPADKKGVKKGDVITSVNSAKVTDQGYNNAVAALSSDSSAKVSFIVKRGKHDYKFSITKDNYAVSSVEYRMISENVGCIRITEFNDTTPAQFETALTSMKSQSITGLLIDVRDNAGGSYADACEILDKLLPAGNLMITVTADGKEKTVTSENGDYKVAMCVLVNEGTMGAAEMFAGAIADYKRCDVVGVSTYGLTTMQEVFPLSSGAAVKLTTCNWKTPFCTLRSENGKIVPDYEVKLTDYQLVNRFLLEDADDPQIQTALDRVAYRQSTMETYEYNYASETDIEPEEEIEEESPADETTTQATTAATTASTKAPVSNADKSTTDTH